MENNLIYLSLGTNLGDREKNLANALKEIEKIAVLKKASAIYETTPVGYKKQGLFLNMVVGIETEMRPLELIVKLQEIEHKMGRNRSMEIKKGPRIIDIDILLYKDEIINEKHLKIPHPEMHKRKFVLIPLNEIAPEIKYPELKNSDKVTIWTKKK